jgi:hypothetical protein
MDAGFRLDHDELTDRVRAAGSVSSRGAPPDVGKHVKVLAGPRVIRR